MQFVEFWEEMNRVISESELMTGIPYLTAVPGLVQYLQSITKLVISVLSVTSTADIQSNSSPAAMKIVKPSLSIVHLLRNEFHEVRLLALEAVLLWQKKVNAKQTAREGGVLCLLVDLEGILLSAALKEKNLECFYKVGECYCIDV